MKIQIDIPATIHKKLKIYKIEKDFETLQDAVVNILDKKLMRIKK